MENRLSMLDTDAHTPTLGMPVKGQLRLSFLYLKKDYDKKHALEMALATYMSVRFRWRDVGEGGDALMRNCW